MAPCRAAAAAARRRWALALTAAALLSKQGPRPSGAPALVPPPGQADGLGKGLSDAPRGADAGTRRRNLLKTAPVPDLGEGRSSKTARSAQVQPAAGAFAEIDQEYNPTWLSIEDKPAGNLDWLHPQTGFAVAASGLYVFDMLRILCLVPPSVLEVWAVGLIYLGLYSSRVGEVHKLEPHYQVSFYASCGWTIYAWASLVHGMAYGPTPVLPLSLAEPLHTVSCFIFLASCIYFYQYHWGRQIRHALEGRFRPWFALGLASLTAVHGLSVGHIFKVLDDPLWFKTVSKIYGGEWQWVADTRLLELYLTALALFLVILHLRGVLTGTKNAAVVFLGTVILPTAALFAETRALDACPWQHYFMVGPKHF